MQVDMFVVIMREHKLRSYMLKNVAPVLLALQVGGCRSFVARNCSHH